MEVLEFTIIVVRYLHGSLPPISAQIAKSIHRIGFHSALHHDDHISPNVEDTDYSHPVPRSNRLKRFASRILSFLRSLRPLNKKEVDSDRVESSGPVTAGVGKYRTHFLYLIPAAELIKRGIMIKETELQNGLPGGGCVDLQTALSFLLTFATLHLLANT
jgi:hypothetical protein